MKTTLSEKGQVTIPKKYRDQFGLKCGTALEFSVENGKLFATKKIEEHPIRRWVGKGKTNFKGKKILSTDEIMKDLRDDYRP